MTENILQINVRHKTTELLASLAGTLRGHQTGWLPKSYTSVYHFQNTKTKDKGKILKESKVEGKTLSIEKQRKEFHLLCQNSEMCWERRKPINLEFSTL